MLNTVNNLLPGFNLFKELNLLLATLFFLLLFPQYSEAQNNLDTIRVGVFSDQLTLLENLTQHEDCPAVSLQHIGENQMLLEYLIICNLLKTEDKQVAFVLEGYPVVPRLVAAIANGDIDISGFGIWKNESNSNGILHSQPLLEAYQFSKGLYVTAQTLKSLKEQPTKAVNSLVAVSNHNWTYDWQLLNCEFEHVLHIDRYEQMFQMLARKRADVLPLAFGKNSHMTREEFGTTLYPLTGLKLAFPDSTHILISHKNPDASKLKKRLNTELNKLRSHQKLVDWYENIGVIKQQVKNWRGLCTEH